MQKDVLSVLRTVDIPNANHFSYRRFTIKELTDAFTKIYQESSKQKTPVFFGNEAAMNAIRLSVLKEWEIVQMVQTPCPNCKETALDGHCPYCDYPYNK